MRLTEIQIAGYKISLTPQEFKQAIVEYLNKHQTGMASNMISMGIPLPSIAGIKKIEAIEEGAGGNAKMTNPNRLEVTW